MTCPLQLSESLTANFLQPCTASDDSYAPLERPVSFWRPSRCDEATLVPGVAEATNVATMDRHGGMIAASPHFAR